MFCCGPLISPRLPRQPLQVLWHLSSSNMLPQNLFSCHLFISRKLSLTIQTNSRDPVTWGQTHLFSGPLLLLLWAPFHLCKGCCLPYQEVSIKRAGTCPSVSLLCPYCQAWCFKLMLSRVGRKRNWFQACPLPFTSFVTFGVSQLEPQLLIRSVGTVVMVAVCARRCALPLSSPPLILNRER